MWHKTDHERNVNGLYDPTENPVALLDRLLSYTHLWSHRRRTAKILLLEPFLPQRSLNPKLNQFGLSPRQKEIATLVIRGFSNKEIAERLFITEQTVKDHLHDIFERIHVRRRSELVAKVLGTHSLP